MTDDDGETIDYVDVAYQVETSGVWRTAARSVLTVREMSPGKDPSGTPRHRTLAMSLLHHRLCSEAGVNPGAIPICLLRQLLIMVMHDVVANDRLKRADPSR